MSETSSSISIIGDSAPEYRLVYSSDSSFADQVLSSELSNIFSEGGYRVRSIPDSAGKATEYEILIGKTNRALSKELLSVIEFTDDGSQLIWAYAFKNGHLAYLANSDTAFEYGKNDFLSLISKDGTLSVPENLYVIKTKAISEYEEELKEQERLEREKSLNDLIARNDSYTQDMFGGDPKSMGKSPYLPPESYPTKGQHPRLFLTGDRIVDIRNILNDPEYLKIAHEFWKEADAVYHNGYKIIDGYYDEWKNGELYRYNGAINSYIENKALAYLITGDEIYGYEAIIGIKQMMLTLKYSRNVSPNDSQATGARHVTATLSRVYDWCYDLLSEEDKNQIIGGVCHLMLPHFTEWQFPPANMSAVSGHGTGPLFFVNYMSLALAFYDEMPDWWEFVGGRYYEEYVPVVLEQTKGGWVSQGTACYGPGKLYDSLVPGYMLYISNGIFPYNIDDIETAAYYILSHEMPSGRYFASGDGVKFNTGVSETYPWVIYMISALTKNMGLSSYLKTKSENFSSCASDFSNDVTWAKLLTLIAYMPLHFLENIDYDNFELIQSFAEPAAQITARSSWDSDAVSIMMRIGTLTMANHDNYDHGTFQIYYKGLLTGPSGSYPTYGSDEHIYYAQQTVAYNGLLIFDPTLADDEPLYVDGRLANSSRYYYSGSQQYRREAGTIDAWQGGDYDMGDLISVSSKYNYDGTVKFAYIAGDITTSYNPETVDYVGRRMLSIFTGDEDFPMYFFVHDSITNAGNNPDFRKQFLLHTAKEPELDKDAMTVTVTEGEGTLVMHSLLGWETVEKIGGEGFAYWINGKNYYNTDGSLSGKNLLNATSNNDRSDIIWGRAELTASGNVHDDMLVAMYVKDSDNKNTLNVEKYENEFLQGAEIGAVSAAFIKSDKLWYKSFEFSRSDPGLTEYYIAGLESGTWQIYVDGIRVAHTYVAEGEGILNFYAPPGKIEITPGPDVIGMNGGKIHYNLGGGKLPDGAPIVYNNEEETLLPTDMTHPNGNVFVGWFTSPNYDERTRIYSIPAGTTGTFRVYAKWLVSFTLLDFNNGLFKNTGISKITFTPELSTAYAMRDENGKDYIEWTQIKDDPRLQITNSAQNFANMHSDTVSYSFTFGRDADGEFPNFNSLVLESNKDINGKDRVWGTLPLLTFEKDSKGDLVIKSGVNGAELATATADNAATVKFTIDFKNELLVYYDENNDVYSCEKFTVPKASGATTGIEWKLLIQSSVVYWRCDSNKDGLPKSVRIYDITITEGDRFKRTFSEGSIDYDLSGGKLSQDAPREYSKDVPTPLPVPFKKNATFIGWFTDPNFDKASKITEVPTDANGIFKVYAKWNNIFVNEDYSETDFHINSETVSALKSNGLSYVAAGKAGAIFETDEDESGRRFLRWVKGSSDPSFSVNSPGAYSFAGMTEKCASYEISISRDADAPILATSEIILESDKNTAGESAWGTLKLLCITSDGDIKCAADSVTIGNISDGSVLTVRMVINFESGTLTFYNELGRAIHSKSFTAPEKSEASSTLEWKSLITRYMIYVRANSGSVSDDAALRFYGIKIGEGNFFEKEAGERDIEYFTNGGILPEGAPYEYSKDSPTVLPIPTKQNAIFIGWYTSMDFEESTKVTSVATSSEGPFAVYAKWNNVLFNEDFSKTEINHDHSTSSNPSFNGLNLTVKGKSEASFASRVDENGASYLLWTKGTSDPGLSITNPSGYSFAAMQADSVSYEIKISRDADAPILASTEIILESNVDMSGNSAWGTLNLLKIYSDGSVACGVDSTVIGSIADGSILTVRMVIDFQNGTISFYRESGSEIHSVSFSAPEKSGAETTAEWKTLIQKYMIYWRANLSSVPADATLRIYGIKIAEGNLFVKDVPEKYNAIKYNLAGGSLPETYPDEYSKDEPTTLPTPSKQNAIFGGWYASEDFSGEAIKEIPVDAEGKFTLYAKWLTVFIDESFDDDIDATADVASNLVHNNITYVTRGKLGASFKTDTDTNGRRFLRWVKGESDPNFSILNASTGTVAEMKENVISYEISFSRDGNTPILPLMNFDLESSVNTTGQSTTGSLQLIKSYTDGEIRCAINNVTIGNISDGTIFTLRLTLDFKKGEFIIYGDALEIVTSGTFSAPTKSGASSTLEWKSLINKYLLYVKANTAAAVVPESAIRFYNIKIAEGNIFV
ncbi:MAG: InlB B-repeat-containing protein [Clostridia bacterium]|nr:InlB B-repeat-containing protein [Clostridia bacterium]